MNTEHETLSRDLENLRNRLTDTGNLVAKLEVSLDKKLRDAEEALDTYTNLLNVMNLFPPLPPPLEDVDFRLSLNNASANASELLLGADVREVIKPKLGVVAELRRLEKADVESESIKVDHELDQLLLTCENFGEEIMEVSKKVEALNEQADELREVRELFNTPGADYSSCVLGGTKGSIHKQHRSGTVGKRACTSASCSYVKWRRSEDTPTSESNSVRVLVSAGNLRLRYLPSQIPRADRQDKSSAGRDCPCHY